MQSSPAIFGGLLPKQIRRALPLYIICAVLFLLFLKADHFERVRHTPGDVLSKALSYHPPPGRDTKTSRIPRKIWQTWKTDPLEFEDRDSSRARSWPSKNPGHRYEVLTDGNDLLYVEEHFGPDGVNRPDIVETYRSLTTTIIKADLLRYLVMYVEGGVYADIDVENLREVNTWIPPHFDENDVDLIIGIEIDEPNYANHTILGPKSQSFCQWTFACKPKMPVMLKLIDHVMHWLNEIAQGQNVPVGNITLNFNEVITGTGPSAFTNSILGYMRATTGQALPWSEFHALKEPKLVGNILVLTVEAFAAGQGHSNSGNHDSELALVKHHYHASLWPSRHPRYSHPAYGMVEECNWKPECVQDWDRNMAGFDALPEERKQELIEEHTQYWKDKTEQEERENRERRLREEEENDDKIREKCEDLFVLGFQRKPKHDEEQRPAPEPEPEPKPEEQKQEGEQGQEQKQEGGEEQAQPENQEHADIRR